MHLGIIGIALISFLTFICVKEDSEDNSVPQDEKTVVIEEESPELDKDEEKSKDFV